MSLVQRGREWPLSALCVVRSDSGVQLASVDGALKVDLVEHLLAALAGLRIHSGIAIEVNGPEVPVLDAASGAWAAMLKELAIESMPPRLRVTKPARIEVDGSSYEFRPSGTVDVSVEVDFSRQGLGQETARWDGSAESFLAEFAPARSFGFLADYASLRESGRAAGATGSPILVFDSAGRRIDSGPPAQVGELARHKLLDLLGDFYLCSGPPLGRVRAARPGHSRNIRAARRALELGIMAPSNG